MIRDDESGRAYEFGEAKFRGAAPPPAAVQATGQEGTGATLVLLTFAPRNTIVGLVVTKK